MGYTIGICWGGRGGVDNDKWDFFHQIASPEIQTEIFR